MGGSRPYLTVLVLHLQLVGKRTVRHRCISRDPVAMMALSLLLMRWICISAAVSATTALSSDDESNRLQPCTFNPLCRCTRSGPNLGMVFCEDVPLADLPVAINNSKAFAMHLRRNGLRRLEDNLFQGTGKDPLGHPPAFRCLIVKNDFPKNRELPCYLCNRLLRRLLVDWLQWLNFKSN